MAEKGIYVRFMSALRKDIVKRYPFVHKVEKAFDLSMPKSSTFYLGLSPRYGKHVIVVFYHDPKSWNVGMLNIMVHISTDYAVTKNWDARMEGYETFEDGFYGMPTNAAGLEPGYFKHKYWLLKPLDKERYRLAYYWRPSSYDSDEQVIREAMVDVYAELEEHLFRHGGFLAE